MDALRIERGSEAWKALVAAVNDDDAGVIHLAFDPDLKVKVNGGMWTPNLAGARRVTS